MIAPMFAQLALGSGLIVATILVGSVFWIALESALLAFHPWLIRPPHRLKLTIALAAAVTGTLAMIAVSVWIWAFAFRLLGLFDTTEGALYFALTAFTTLGFGDVLLPAEWRLLGGMAAANGFLSFGLVTALLIETMRNLRLRQRGET